MKQKAIHEAGAMTPCQPKKNRLGITLHTALLSWLVTTATLLIFVWVIIPMQKRTFLENLESKAHSLAISVREVGAALVVENYQGVVDHCNELIAADTSIDYLVITKNDGFSMIHNRSGWCTETLSGDWRPRKREPSSGITLTRMFDRLAFQYSEPIYYSEIGWGWIHVGLSLDSYNRSVSEFYRRICLLAVFCLILSLGASVVYAKRLVHPILSLQTVLQKVANGDLSARASITSGNELESLGSSVNSMTQSLLRRDTIMQSVHFAAQQFIGAQDWRTVIDRVLESIGQAVQATQMTIFKNGTDEKGNIIARRKYEWFSNFHLTTTKGAAFYAISPPDPRLERGLELLQAGKSCLRRWSDASDVERSLMNALGIKSIIFTPIMVAGKWWGFLTMSDHYDEREWTESEVIFLQAAVNTLGSAIERQQSREALVQAKEAAEAASRAKSQFLANMSHEIRTPITGVMGMLRLLDHTSLTEKQAHYKDNALTSAQLLLTVIGDILDFSKIEAGKMTLEESAFSIHEIIDSSVRLFGEQAEQKKLELIYRVPEPLPRVLYGDPNRLRQILVNLIGNALKFTEKGEIEISCNVAETGVETILLRFEVRDTGCGIAPEQQARIFDAFSQADNSMTRSYGGTGLGLTICRQLCKIMHGEIGVRSAPEQGSTFWFTVRLVNPPGSEAPPPLKDLAGLRILVVDDCAIARTMVSDYVRSWRGIPQEAPDAATGLQMLESAAQAGDPFPVAVLDWQMPGMDGKAMAQAIKQNPRLRNTGLILLSSFSQVGETPDQASSSFAAQVPKPARKSDLYDALICAANAGSQTPKKDPAQPAPLPPPASIARKKGKVLLAEDNAINQEVALEMLTELGYQHCCVSNGREALEVVKSGGADLALMDCQMPEMDGYDATRAIRAWEKDVAKGGHMPIIALTAHAMAGDRDICLEAGMDDYLTKPLDPDVLARTLTHWFTVIASGKKSMLPPETMNETDKPERGIDYPSLLRRCMGKQALAQRLLEKFIQQSGHDLQEMDRAIGANEALALMTAAHRLKGSAANLSAAGVRQIATALEVAGRDKNMDEARLLLPQLVLEMQFVRDAQDAKEELL